MKVMKMKVSFDESKDTLKTIENYGAKSKILLDKKTITRTIMMKNIWESNLIQIIVYK